MTEGDTELFRRLRLGLDDLRPTIRNGLFPLSVFLFVSLFALTILDYVCKFFDRGNRYFTVLLGVLFTLGLLSSLLASMPSAND